MFMPAYTTAPGEEDILAMAEAALAALPQRLSRHLEGLTITVEDMADEETLASLQIESAWELTGLYRGIPMTERSVSDPVRLPDTNMLYRDPILIEWIETGEDLARLVGSVLVHEVAHHFGFSDAEIERIEADMLDR